MGLSIFFAVGLCAGLGFARAWYLQWRWDRSVLNTKLHAALDKQDLQAVEEALRRGADPNAEERPGTGFTGLMHAVEHGNPALVKALLQAGADRQRRDRTGTTALEQAQKAHLPEIIKLLQKP